MKFVTKYGEHLSSPVHLKLPNGAEWEIELRRCNNGGVWFDKGWPEFSKFCSLDYANWLVFGYEGNSNFHVLIFDRTSTEVEYHITKPEMEKTDYEKKEEEEEEDDNSVEILDGFPPCPRKAREKSPLPCPQPHKKMRTCGKAECNINFRPTKTQTSLRNKASDCSRSEMKKEDESDDDSVETLDTFPSCPKTGDKSPLAPSEVKDRVGRMHASTTSGKAIALQRAIAFESVNPSFTVVMQPSYIKNGPLTVPTGFAKRHLTKQPANAILKVSDGGTWSVKFAYPKLKATFQQGWRVFVRDNNLKLGDVCVFILIKDIKLSFEAHFPRPFARKHLVKQSAGNIILKILDGRTWPVEFKYENSTARFQNGWSAFARDNNLKVGDVCVFVLIDRNECLFEVVFYRTNKAEDCPLSSGKDGFLAKKGGGGTSSTRRFQKRTPGFLERMHPSTKNDHEDDPEFFHPSQKQRRVLQQKKRTSSSRKARAGPEFFGAWAKILK
ncbi:hypothetical protein ACE6H2_024513 [Prunus campanulata]